MSNFYKLLRPGKMLDRSRTPLDVFVEVTWVRPELSFVGVVGPRADGDADGGCGQIQQPKIIEYAPGWNENAVKQLWWLWDRWHLNNARPGCEHQMADGWDKRPIDPGKPLDAYGKHYPGQRVDSWNTLTWVRPSEFPGGLLTAPCPICGYRYGSAWMLEEVPESVLKFLARLPDADYAMPKCWMKR